MIVWFPNDVKFNLAKLDKAEPGKGKLRSPDEKGPMHPEAGAGGGNWQRIAPPPSKQTPRATIYAC